MTESRVPSEVRKPIEDMLRADLARAMRAVRAVTPTTEVTPAMLQCLAEGVRVPLGRIDDWAMDGYLKVGRVLTEIKGRVGHGGFMRLFEDGRNRVPTPIPMPLQKAEALMRVATNKSFRDPEVRKALPIRAWRTLDELTRVEPGRLRRGVKRGVVHPAMTRAAATRLQKHEDPPTSDGYGPIRRAIAAHTGDKAELADFLEEVAGTLRATVPGTK